MARSQPVAPPAPPPGVPGHRLVRALGGGGFATVWEARPEAGGPAVAIKIGNAATALARARFAREAEILERLDTAHVPAIHGRGELADGRPYLIEECLRGTPLSVILGELPAPPSIDWVRDTFGALLASLEALHARGIVHGDLKPEHAFLGHGDDSSGPGAVPDAATMRLAEASGRVDARVSTGIPARVPVRLIDFGLIGLPPGSDAAPGATAAGTREYMAPEQFDGHVDVRSDIYAAGVILYEMLTLRVPFVGNRAEIEHGHRALRPPPPGSPVAIPQALQALCLACLSKDPTDRPADVATLRDRLEAACAAAPGARGSAPAGACEHSTPRPVLDSGRQLVVVLAVLGADGVDVDAVVARHQGVVTRQQGARYVCCFSSTDQVQPSDSALAAAREILAAGNARAALHLARLRARRGRRALRFYGPAVETPDEWLPGQAWSGLVLTPSFANALPHGAVRPSPEAAGFCVPSAAAGDQARADRDGDVELIGRGAALAGARASVDEARAQGSPGLLTIYGDNGLGKSRMARELCERAARWWPGARVISLRVERTPREHAHHALRQALAACAPAPAEDPGAGGEALRAAAEDAPLVVILDDVQHADGDTLDAIEYATLDGDDVPLWIAVCAHPRLARRRPRWGQRAHRHTQIELDALAEPDAMDMAAALLRPAEYTPAAALRKLARWAAGNPQVLCALVQRLKRDGIVRQHSHGASWYLDTARLTRLPASPALQWLASRTMESLLPDLAACLQLCAVLGLELARDELAWVQDEMWRAGQASTHMDPDVGLSQLEERGFVIGLGAGVWMFSQAAFRDAIYELVSAGDRARIHRAALSFWLSQPQDQERVLEALARHALASGVRDQAADAYRALGDRARRQHRDVEAEQHYSVALDFVDVDDHTRRVHLLGARGRARYRMQRCEEAQRDLRAAQEHARALGDIHREAALLLEEATALDWAERFAESTQRSEQAGALIVRCGDPVLAARQAVAWGRSLFRKGQMSQAIELLEHAAALAESCGDRETSIVAVLLLGPALVCVNRLPEAEQAFERAMALCDSDGDRLHLCAAYSNRSFLWAARRSFSGMLADMRRTLELARELGQPMAERVAAHNLAEFLHWSGKPRKALSLARRALALQRFLPDPVASDALLLARIHAALGERDQAHALLARARALLADKTPSRSEQIAMRMLDLLLSQARGAHDVHAWEALVAAAVHAELPGEELLEVHYFRGLAALDAGAQQALGQVVASARLLLAEYPVWRQPFDELARRIQRDPDS